MATDKEIKNALDSYFNLEDINALCLDLGFPYEDIRHDGKTNTIISLIGYAKRRDQTAQLVTYINQERPHANLDPTVSKLAQTPAGVPTQPAQPQPQSGIIYNVQGDWVGGDKVGKDKVGGDKITVGNISNSTGIAIGRNASAQVTIGTVPENREAFSQQLNELKALLEQAIASGEIEQESGSTALNDLQDIETETGKESPRSGRITRRLEDMAEVISAAGKAGTAVLKATPVIAALMQAVKLIF